MLSLSRFGGQGGLGGFLSVLTKIASSPILTISGMGINISVLPSLKPLHPVAVKPLILPSGRVKVTSHNLPKFLPSEMEITSNFLSLLKENSI